MKNTTKQPLKRKWTGQIGNNGKSIRLKWVNAPANETSFKWLSTGWPEIPG